MWRLNFISSHCIFLFFARPVYNREKFITEAICLIVNQDYGNFELIITDNASMDGTERFCRDFAACGEHKSYVRNERNRGAGPNHNLGFKLSSRECFKWCVADERISRDFLSARVSVLDKNLDVVLVYGLIQGTDKDGRLIPLVIQSNPRSHKSRTRSAPRDQL